MNCLSKIRVYTYGIVQDGIGAYAYIVLESEDCGEIEVGGGRGRLFAPSLLKAKFAQAGPATDDVRMKMRAVYEGVRHCPDNRAVEVYTEHPLIDTILRDTKPTEEDGDIAVRYRQYLAEHKIQPTFGINRAYNGRDFPNNDDDEWSWWAHTLCEDAIKRYEKEHKTYTKKKKAIF